MNWPMIWSMISSRKPPTDRARCEFPLKRTSSRRTSIASIEVEVARKPRSVHRQRAFPPLAPSRRGPFGLGVAPAHGYKPVDLGLIKIRRLAFDYLPKEP